MDIHEYQAKELLSKFGVPIPRGGLAYSPEQATYRATEIGGNKWVVKAQIHSGARGKAGGIKVCSNDTEIERAAEALLGKKLVDDPDRPRRQARLAPLHRGSDRHRQGDLSRVRHGPRLRAHRRRRLGGRRHGDRGDLGQTARHHHPRRRRPRGRHAGRSRRARWPSAWASIPRSSTSS